MTIAERFAKYTTERLAQELARLEKKLADDRAAVEYFRAKKDIEFFQMAQKSYEETYSIYLDVKCAYEAR